MVEALGALLGSDGFWSILTTAGGGLIVLIDKYFGVSRHIDNVAKAKELIDFVESDSFLDRLMKKGDKAALEKKIVTQIQAITALRLLELQKAESPLGQLKAKHLNRIKVRTGACQAIFFGLFIILGLLLFLDFTAISPRAEQFDQISAVFSLIGLGLLYWLISCWNLKQTRKIEGMTKFEDFNKVGEPITIEDSGPIVRLQGIYDQQEHDILVQIGHFVSEYEATKETNT